MKESEIRPPSLLSQFLEYAREDALYLCSRGQFVHVACPGCNTDRATDAFVKHGFRYVVCNRCGSLYNSPRPTKALLAEHYQRGKSVKFWDSDLFRRTAESRKDLMFRPRAESIARLVKKYHRQNCTFLDIGCGYGLFYEELKKLALFDKIIGVEPSPELANSSRKKGLCVIEKNAEALEANDACGTMAAAFEVIEHVFDPDAFLQGIGRALQEDGLLYITTLTISGFDLQVLWQNSTSIFPPHHITLLSLKGIETLVERAGYDLVDLSTPGKLDVDIVANAINESPNIDFPHFVRDLLNRGDKAREDFQSFLSKYMLSSHVHIVAQKKPEKDRSE